MLMIFVPSPHIIHMNYEQFIFPSSVPSRQMTIDYYTSIAAQHTHILYSFVRKKRTISQVDTNYVIHEQHLIQ